MDGERRNTLLLAMITVKGGNSNAWHGAQRILNIEGVKGKERTDMMREFWSRRKASVAAKRKEMPK